MDIIYLKSVFGILAPKTSRDQQELGSKGLKAKRESNIEVLGATDTNNVCLVTMETPLKSARNQFLVIRMPKVNTQENENFTSFPGNLQA